MATKREYMERGFVVAGKALRNGAAMVTTSRVVADASGDCSHPVGFEKQYTRFDKNLDPRHWGLAKVDHTLVVSGDARCRKCENCKRFRARVWTKRALNETSWAARTWFGTLTCRPDVHHMHLTQARLRAHRAGFDLDLEPTAEQFRRHVARLGEELTKYIKRVRKALPDGARLRYMFVVEQHNGGGRLHGFPHLHCLIHEAQPHTVRKAILRQQWSHGFTRWKLVDRSKPAAVWYVCKYLSKENVARVRASSRYGEPTSVLASEQRSVSNRPPNAAVAAPQPADVCALSLPSGLERED